MCRIVCKTCTLYIKCVHTHVRCAYYSTTCIYNVNEPEVCGTLSAALLHVDYLRESDQTWLHK